MFDARRQVVIFYLLESVFACPDFEQLEEDEGDFLGPGKFIKQKGPSLEEVEQILYVRSPLTLPEESTLVQKKPKERPEATGSGTIGAESRQKKKESLLHT